MREVFLRLALVFGVLLAAGTEGLSAGHALVPVGVALFWGACLCALGGWGFWRAHRDTGTSPVWPLRFNALPFTRFQFVVVVFISLMAAAIFIQGFFSAPNAFDSMTYHLSRVMHWAQARSVRFYPSHIERQLWMPPLAEYGVLHLYLLTGTDRLAFLIQWLAYIGCIVAASSIAFRLGAGRAAQVAAAAFCASVPMAVLQGASTQTDLFATFWLMGSMVWLMAWCRTGFQAKDALISAAFMGLALLAKTSMLLFAVPFGVLAAVVSWRARRLRSLGALALVFVTVILLISGPHLARVYRCYGSFNPVDSQAHLTNEDYSLKAIVSNMIKNIALNMATPSQRFNDHVRAAVDQVHALMGMDGASPAFSLDPSAEYLKKSHVFYESRAPNLLHLLLGAGVLVLLLAGVRVWPLLVVGYGLALTAGFLLLVIYMKWQPWITRFQMTLFMLGAPLAAIVMARVGAGQRVLKAAAIALLVAAVPWIMFNSSRPFIGDQAFYRVPRLQQYLEGDPSRAGFFNKAVDEIALKQCAAVGLWMNDQEAWEYPLWVLLRERGLTPRIRHVRVKPPSVYEDAAWRPCVVISYPEVVR